MKTIKNMKALFLILMITCMCQVSVGQNYSDDEDTNSETVTEYNGENVSPDFFSSLFNTTVNPKLSTVQGNSVFITQIGESNQVAADITANASEINLTQNGDFNNVELVYLVDKVVTDLVQNGNSNKIKDYVIDTNAEISLDLSQTGNNLKFERFGTNEITKNIKFTQTEASPSIIIRSFN